MRRHLVTIAIAVAALPLTGCAILATPAPPVTSSPTATGTPAPSPTASRVVKIELGPQVTRALTAGGAEVWHVDYDSDPASAVTRLSEVLGEPRTSEHAGTPNGDVDLPRTDYDWSGLTLESPHYNGDQPSGDGLSDYSIVATAPTSHGVALASGSGVVVGMSDSDLATIAADYPSGDSAPSDGWRDLEGWTRTLDGSEVTDWISVRSANGVVERIFATAHSYGA